MPDETVNVRYIVDDVAASIDFSTRHLGFTLLSAALPAFADVTRGPSGNPVELFQPAGR